MPNITRRAWAIFFAREVLAFIFFMAGVYKVFQLGPLEHARKYFLPFADTFLPVWSLWATGAVIPFVELVAGGLLLIGLRITCHSSPGPIAFRSPFSGCRRPDLSGRLACKTAENQVNSGLDA